MVPSWLRGSTDVVAIGGTYSIFCVAAILASSQRWRSSQTPTMAVHVESEDKDMGWMPPFVVSLEARDVFRGLGAACLKNDEELRILLAGQGHDDTIDTMSVVPKLALMYAVMVHCSFARITYQPSCGLCHSMLVSEQFFEDEGRDNHIC